MCAGRWSTWNGDPVRGAGVDRGGAARVRRRHRPRAHPPPGYLAGVRALCDRYGICFIADEVMAGFGRTGRWFAIDHWDVAPDLIVFAKGSNSGYVPVGGVIISDAVAATFDDRVFPGGLTYSGHPLACASIVASIDAMRRRGWSRTPRASGDRARPRAARPRRPAPGDRGGARARRLLGAGPGQRPRDTGDARPVRRQLAGDERAGRGVKKRGLLPFTNYNRMHVVPPCTVSDTEVKDGLAILDEVFSVVDQHYEG